MRKLGHQSHTGWTAELRFKATPDGKAHVQIHAGHKTTVSAGPELMTRSAWPTVSPPHPWVSTELICGSLPRDTDCFQFVLDKAPQASML